MTKRNSKKHDAGTIKAGQKVGGQFAPHERKPAAPPGLADQFPHLTSEALEHIAGQIEEHSTGNERPDWANKQERRKIRGHDFYPGVKRLSAIPRLDDPGGSVAGPAGKICHLKYFSPAGTFYVTELDPKTGEAFGVFQYPIEGTDWTYMNLPDAEKRMTISRKVPAVWERDLDFQPQRAYDAIPEEFGHRIVERLPRGVLIGITKLYDENEALWTRLMQNDLPEGTTLKELHQEAHQKKDELEAALKKYGIRAHHRPGKSFTDSPISNRDDFVDEELEATLGRSSPLNHK